jgi:hypothetical protein
MYRSSVENKMVMDFDNELTQEFSIEYQMLAELDLRNIPIGSFAVLSANDPENAENEYQHENIIKVGNDIFTGFPLEKSKGSIFMSMDEIKQTVSKIGRAHV